MKDLNKLFNQCKSNLESINIPIAKNVSVSVNTRAKTRWGLCSKRGNGYSIQIASVLLGDDVDDIATVQTIYHELIHTCYGCMNHGDLWKHYGDRVYKAYGIKIERTTSAEEKGVELPKRTVNYRYKIVCNRCDRSWNYQRESKVVKSCRNNKAECPCGAHNFLVINL